MPFEEWQLTGPLRPLTRGVPAFLQDTSPGHHSHPHAQAQWLALPLFGKEPQFAGKLRPPEVCLLAVLRTLDSLPTGAGPVIPGSPGTLRLGGASECEVMCLQVALSSFFRGLFLTACSCRAELAGSSLYPDLQ